MGTTKGLNRYDGHSFTIYRHRASDSSSLGADNAVAMYEDSLETLWVGTPAGLSRYDRARDSFENFSVVAGQAIQVSAILDAVEALDCGPQRGERVLELMGHVGREGFHIVDAVSE